MRIRRAVLVCSAVLLLSAPGWAGRRSGRGEASVSLGPGDYDISIQHDGRGRSYVVHLPPQAREGKPLPVVLNFHGAGSNAESHQSYTRMDRVADREGFLAVYPNGTGRFRNRFFTWNAGQCCGYAQNHDVDDVSFVRALIDDLGRRAPIDPRRVYATGMSNGAMFSYRLACEASDRIAAVAPVAGALSLRECAPARPVPVLHIHSVDDPLALYKGGIGAPFPALKESMEHEPVEETLRTWARIDRCPETPSVGPSVAAARGSRDEGQTAVKYTYGPCADSTEIVHWKLAAAGHVWPGGKPDTLRRVLGRSTAVIDANEEIWRFVSRYSLPPPAAPPPVARLASLMAGTFSSEEQALEDPEYKAIALVMAPVWRDRADGAWLYVEQAVKGAEDRPYRQRVYHVTMLPDGKLESRVFSLPDPASAVGEWRKPSPLHGLSPEALALREGCSVVLAPRGDGTFAGGTVGKGCASDLRGAAYATSEVVVTETGITSWDRGFDDKEVQVWGATKGPYRFRKTGSFEAWGEAKP